MGKPSGLKPPGTDNVGKLVTVIMQQHELNPAVGDFPIAQALVQQFALFD